MLNVYLLRHGESLWNADNNRYCGRTDIALNEKGMAQAHLVKEQLKHVDFMEAYASPLQRAYITAQIVSGKEVVKDERLIETDFGTWEGKPKEIFIPENEILWNNWMDNPVVYRAGGTGETATEIIERADSFYSDLHKKYANGNVLVVAHNGINRFYLAYKLGMPLKNYRQLIQHNSLITCFTLDEKGVLFLEFLNSKL